MRRIPFILLLLLSNNILSQDIDRHHEYWAGATFKYKLNKKWDISLEEQFRAFKNGSLKNSFTEIGLRLKLNELFALKASYRHTIRVQQRNRDRITLALYATWKKKDFPLSVHYRLRTQYAIENWTNQKIIYLRSKIMLKYNASKLVDPYIGYESFVRLFFDDKAQHARYKLGLDWRLGKNFDLDSFYAIESEGNRIESEVRTILGLMVKYTF